MLLIGLYSPSTMSWLGGFGEYTGSATCKHTQFLSNTKINALLDRLRDSKFSSEWKVGLPTERERGRGGASGWRSTNHR